MFGKPDWKEWTPLTIDKLCEGWCDPWVAPPDGTGGSLRQGWLGVPDAFFNRMLVGFDTFAKGNHGGPDANSADFLYETPITRRYMIGFVVPFADTLSATPTAGAKTEFGDVTIENRFLLHETKAPDHFVQRECHGADRQRGPGRASHGAQFFLRVLPGRRLWNFGSRSNRT